MSKVIIWVLVTLDGYFEGEEKWDLGFHSEAWCEELDALSRSFGKNAACLVFGRTTYEGMKNYWTTADESEASEVRTFMNALPKLVASHTLTQSDWNNTRVTSDIAAGIRALKADAAPDKNIYVFGSAKLSHALMSAGLVDELMLAIVPIQLGKGTPFFKEGSAPRRFRLIETRPLPNGTLILRYAPGDHTGTEPHGPEKSEVEP
ncbi:MAG: riboflavin biosynthesis protein RibD [Nitratireductor sp.]|nr:riboflavin biosynthesis protein RibD [Nitratireductor sp.]